MIRRTAIGGLVLVLAAATVSTAHAEPSGLPAPTGSSAFKRLDLGALGKITNVPQLARQDKVVSALVQLSGDPVSVQRTKNAGVSTSSAKQRVKSRQDAAIPKLKAAGATTYGRLDTVLNAVQVRVKVADLEKLAAVPGVTKVQVSRQVTPQNSASNAYTGADRAWQYLGRTGKGQTVGIIDTGIDYLHADFGGPGTVAAFEANDSTTIESGSFPTAKVVAGYDFVGDDYNAASDDPAALVPQPDPDPLDCEGHGSHVAGTAAGSGVTTAGKTYAGPYNRATTRQRFDVEPGSAPEAKLAAYRVFGCEGSVNDDIIVAAIDRATNDGVDIINMSLGSTFGANNLNDVAIANATSAGVLVVVSAGNDGPGAYLVGSPSTSDTALSVAASDTEFASYPGVKITGAASANGLVANGVAVASPITGVVDEVGLGCSASDYAGSAGKIVVSTRGTCDRVARAEFGQQAGAKAVIMINTDASLPPFEGAVPGVTIPFVGVSGTSGPALVAADGQSVTLTAAATITNPNYGGISDFSSNGPRYGDSAQKPDVTAPGVSIPSAAVGSGTEAVRLSGTSMSAPHTAGVAALVRQSHPSWTARQIKAVIQSTGQPSRVKGYDSQSAGTGLVQPRHAVQAQVYAWTSSGLNSLKFGMNELSGAHVETQSYKVTNRSKKTFTYDVAAQLSTPARGAALSISPRSFTVKPGETKKVAVTMRFSRYDVNRLPGVGASDGGVVSSIHGRIVATPRKADPTSPVLQTTFMFVPVPLSKVKSSTTVEPTGNTYTGIKATNEGSHPGRATAYSWLLADAAGDGFEPTVADVTNLGVATYPGAAAGAAASDRLMVFAATQATGTSTQSVHEIDVLVDTDGDEEADYYVIGLDAGLLLAGTPDGTFGSFVIDAATNQVTAGYVASAPANGSTVTLPVLASDLGLTSASAPVTLTAAGFSVLSPAPGDIFTELATYNPFKPVTNSGASAILKVGQSATFATAVDSTQLASQTHAGWLVVTPDDRSGLQEADRVALVLPKASPARGGVKPR